MTQGSKPPGSTGSSFPEPPGKPYHLNSALKNIHSFLPPFPLQLDHTLTSFSWEYQLSECPNPLLNIISLLVSEVSLFVSLNSLVPAWTIQSNSSGQNNGVGLHPFPGIFDLGDRAGLSSLQTSILHHWDTESISCLTLPTQYRWFWIVSWQAHQACCRC